MTLFHLHHLNKVNIQLSFVNCLAVLFVYGWCRLLSISQWVFINEFKARECIQLVLTTSQLVRAAGSLRALGSNRKVGSNTRDDKVKKYVDVPWARHLTLIWSRGCHTTMADPIKQNHFTAPVRCVTKHHLKIGYERSISLWAPSLTVIPLVWVLGLWAVL